MTDVQMSTTMTSSSSASVAEEHSNQLAMKKQFARFDVMASEVKKRMTQIEATTQQSGAAAASTSLAPLLQSSYLHLLELKAVSRSLTNLAELTKTQLHARKKRLDVVTLQYESILYEQAHFKKEIAIARDFKSKYPAVELVSESDFRAGTGLGGAGVAPALAADLTAHQLHLARLLDELQRRERLQAQQREAEQRNAQLQAANDALRAKAADFLAHMKAAELHNREMVAQLWPDDGALHLPPTERDAELLPLLPASLYKFYFVADSFAKGHSVAPADFQLQLRGSAVAAAKARQEDLQRAASRPTAATNWTAALAQGAAGEADNKGTVSAAELVQFVSAHPLSVELTLRFPSSAAAASPAAAAASAGSVSLVLQFSYHPHLKVVSVQHRVEGAAAAAAAAAVPSALLTDLYPDDSGARLPLDPLAAYAPRMAQSVQQWAQSGFDSPALGGRPYRWAQLLAGLYVLPPSQPAEAHAPAVSFRTLLDKLAARITAASRV